MRRRDLTMAVVSAVGGTVALALSLTAEDPPVTGLALAGLLLVNALVRFQLARRG